MARSKLTPQEFLAIVDRVVQDLPEPFRKFLQNVAVDLEERPSKQTLRELGYRSDEWYELLGLFQGTPLTEQHFGESHPNRITLYQQSIEAASRTRKEMEYEIRRTLIHELAHHFGFSEDELDEFESVPSPFDEENHEEEP
ncbi:MAG: metallopeptidase family protein [Planctomycetes bacterium]|nr:metallopeptidase family protein [Planctomycetota bacterium]